jgi:hypothetical protein
MIQKKFLDIVPTWSYNWFFIQSRKSYLSHFSTNDLFKEDIEVITGSSDFNLPKIRWKVDKESAVKYDNESEK